MSEKPLTHTPEQLVTPEFVSPRFARSVFEQKESSRKNFFGLEEWDGYYREKGFELSALTDAQREIAEKFPGEWGSILGEKDPLHPNKEIRETHFAFLGVDKINDKPLTLLEWLKLENEALFQKEDPWYRNEDLAKDALSFRWHLMPLQLLPKSENKTWDEQRALLPKDYEVPKAIEEVSKNLLYYRKNIAHLNKKDQEKALKELNYDRWGRTNNLAAHGFRVLVGRFGPDGLRVLGSWGGDRDPSARLSFSRKLKK